MNINPEYIAAIRKSKVRPKVQNFKDRKLSEEQVLEVRRLSRETDFSMSKIGRLVGCHQPTVAKIIRGLHYTDII